MLDSDLSYMVVSNCGGFVLLHRSDAEGQEGLPRGSFGLRVSSELPGWDQLCLSRDWVDPSHLQLAHSLLPVSTKDLCCLRKQYFLL